MRVVTLIENTEGAAGCAFEHGLSLYIETGHHKILSDAGASGAAVKNAEILGIDLSLADICVISHGHYDHGDGLKEFFNVNSKARIIMQQGADEPHFNGDRYIGIDPEILKDSRIEYIDGTLEVDSEISIFAGVTGRRLWPSGNRSMTRTAERLPEDFAHEQYLVLTEGAKKVLISGCAHNGILNILDRYRELFGADPYMVISGFHMMKPAEYEPSELELIKETARELSGMKTVFYSGHCTGAAFEHMKKIMGEQLQRLSTGLTISI